MHTQSVDPCVLQTLCVDGALRLELTKGICTCNKRKTNCAGYIRVLNHEKMYKIRLQRHFF